MEKMGNVGKEVGMRINHKMQMNISIQYISKTFRFVQNSSQKQCIYSWKN